MSGSEEYASYDGLGLAELVRKGEVQPAELVEEAIRRIERVNPQVNAVIAKMYDHRRGVQPRPACLTAPFEACRF